MGLIIETVEIIGTKRSQKFEALFDTGAEDNYINYKISSDELGFEDYY